MFLQHSLKTYLPKYITFLVHYSKVTWSKVYSFMTFYRKNILFVQQNDTVVQQMLWVVILTMFYMQYCKWSLGHWMLSPVLFFKISPSQIYSDHLTGQRKSSILMNNLDFKINLKVYRIWHMTKCLLGLIKFMYYYYILTQLVNVHAVIHIMKNISVILQHEWV